MRVKFYLTSSGRSPIEDFLSEQSFDLNSDFTDAVLLLESGDILQTPLSKNLSSIHRGLHELRLKDSAGIYRFFYFIKRPMAFILFTLLKRKLSSYQKKKLI